MIREKAMSALRLDRVVVSKLTLWWWVFLLVTAALGFLAGLTVIVGWMFL